MTNDVKQVDVSNTLIKGRLTELACISYFLNLGYIVSCPEVPSPYDVLLDVGSKILKIQIKTCHLSKEGDYIEFNTSSMTHNSKGYTKRTYSKENVDYFATFYNDKVYLVPFEECGTKTKHLRLIPTKNGQVKNISFLENYLCDAMLSQYN